MNSQYSIVHFGRGYMPVPYRVPVFRSRLLHPDDLLLIQDKEYTPMKTLTSGDLFDSVLAVAAREGYPSVVTYNGVIYKAQQVGTSYAFRQLTLPTPETVHVELETNDATATVIAEFDVAEDEKITIHGMVQGVKADFADSIDAHIIGGGCRAASANVEVTGSPVISAAEDSSGTPAVTLAADTTGQRVQVKVAGIASEKWHWQAHLQIMRSQI